METRNTKKKIAFLTGTRADFGKIKSLILAVHKSREFSAHIFTTGMHMNPVYGYTAHEVQKLGVPNVYLFINHAEGNVMDMVLASTIQGFSQYVRLIKPDMIVVHGDRVEALAGAIVGALNNILVAHIEGGEISGTIDEHMRHSISKIAHVHFVANNEARKRLIQLGEYPEKVYVIGSPDLDVMTSSKLPTLEEAKRRYRISFDTYALFAYHPVTTETSTLLEHTETFIESLLQSNMNYIGVYPNNDRGTEIIMDAFENRLKGNKRFKIFPSIKFEHYLTFIKHATFMIGNSSAGIRETSFFGVPSINIGNRQKNRINAKKHPSIVHLAHDRDAILKHITMFSHTKKRFPTRKTFGNGKSTDAFLRIIRDDEFWKTAIQKQFKDINFRLPR